MESQSVSLNAPNLSVGERVRIEGPAPLLLWKNCIGSVVMEIAGHLDGFDKDGGSKEQKPKCNSPKGVRNIKREYSSCVPHMKTALLLAHQQPNVHKEHFAKWLLSVKNIILHRNRHTSNTFEELWGLGYVVLSAHQSGTTAFALGSRLPTEMANKGTQLQSLSKVFFLLSIMTVKTNPLETVNVVDFCGQNIQGDGMIVNSHQESKKYYFVTMGTDCHLTMQAASPKDKVQFHFRFFLVYSLLRLAPQSPSPLFPESPESTPVVEQGDPCHAGSYIQFYDGRDKNSPPIGPTLCGKSPPRPVLSTGNHLTLRLVTQGTLPRVDFVGDFTSFRLGFNQSACSSEPYFPCRNGKCIPMSLVCDEKGIDNCGDGSDLEDHLPSGCKGHLAGQLAPAQATPPAVTPTPPVLNPPTFPMSTYRNCGTPDGEPNHDSVTDSPPYLSLLALFITLGVIAGLVLLCWCCWSPGWFLWRIIVCHFLPCCNSACAFCKLCARSCSQNKEHRLAKVSPQGQVTTNNAALATLTTATASATTVAV